MGSMTINRLILVCDGCGALHGDPGGHRSAMDARAAAYGDGWRYPAKLLKSGREASGIKNTSDVCPNCLAGWTSQRIGVTGQGNVAVRAVDQPEEHTP